MNIDNLCFFILFMIVAWVHGSTQSGSEDQKDASPSNFKRSNAIRRKNENGPSSSNSNRLVDNNAAQSPKFKRGNAIRRKKEKAPSSS